MCIYCTLLCARANFTHSEAALISYQSMCLIVNNNTAEVRQLCKILNYCFFNIKTLEKKYLEKNYLKFGRLYCKNYNSIQIFLLTNKIFNIMYSKKYLTN